MGLICALDKKRGTKISMTITKINLLLPKKSNNSKPP